MSTDNIKEALLAEFPGTTESQWKRRSKAKVAEGVERIFENTSTGKIVRTIEADGKVLISDGALKTAKALYDPALAQEVTETMRKIVYDPDLAQKVTETGREILRQIVSVPPFTQEQREYLDGIMNQPAPDLSVVIGGPKTKPVSKRNQMVAGSRWKLTQDVEIHLWISNPRFDQLLMGRSRTAAQQHEIDQMVEKNERVIRAHAATIRAGSILKPIGKFSSAGGAYGVAKNQTNGLTAPFEIDGVIDLEPLASGFANRHPIEHHGWVDSKWEVIGYDLPYNQIEAFVEAEEIPESLVYVLRDRETGLYFGGWKTEDYHYGGGHVGQRMTDEPKMVEKFSSAKKYKTASAVKASIREFTGYNSGINDADGQESAEYYMTGGDKKMDLPPSWEMVAVDKPTAQEKAVHDVQDWYRGLMRLRVLTQGHGSAVRAVYKKAEDDSALTTIVVFQNRSRGSYTVRGRTYDYDNAESFEDMDDGGVALLAAIKKAAEYILGKSARVKTNTSVAYACSLPEAIAVRLAFSHPDAVVKVLDKTTLEEIVENQS